MTRRRKRSGVLAGAGGVVAGVGALVTGLVDPTFLVGAKGLWFPIVSTLSRFVGPAVVPWLPWEGLTLAAAVAFVIVSLYQLGKKAKTHDTLSD